MLYSYIPYCRTTDCGFQFWTAQFLPLNTHSDDLVLTEYFQGGTESYYLAFDWCCGTTTNTVESVNQET